MSRLRAAIPSPPARRPLVDAIVVLIVDRVFVERRDVLRIHQRKNRAHPGNRGHQAAALYRQTSGGPNARAGSWQVPHAILPDADSE